MHDGEAGADRRVPSRPDRAGTIVVLNRDLMFGVRIGNQLRALGYNVVFTPDTAAFREHLRDTRANVCLGILDMNAGVAWNQISDLVAELTTEIPLLAFGPHVDVNGRRAAKAAGVTRIVSNGEFHRDMVKLVDRYARIRSEGP
jgi:hypothetical protein